MSKRLQGLVFIVCGIAAIIGVKLLDAPTLITLIIVPLALVAFIMGLAKAMPTGSSSPDEKIS